MREPSPLFERGASAIPPLRQSGDGARWGRPHYVLEATSGFEPLIEVLQTSALPLGHVAGGGAEDGI